MRNWFGGKFATWNFALKLHGDFSEDSLNTVTRHLVDLQRYEGAIKISAPTKTSRVLMIRGGLNVEMSLQPGGNSVLGGGKPSYIFVVIQNLRINLSEAASVLNKEIIPLVAEIEKVSKPAERLYGITVEFDKANNPFLGLYLERFDPSAISHFQIVLDIKDYGEDDLVTISGNKIQISASSFHAITELSKEFLTLHPKLEARLRDG
jgi:hypothetical protein